MDFVFLRSSSSDITDLDAPPTAATAVVVEADAVVVCREESSVSVGGLTAASILAPREDDLYTDHIVVVAVVKISNVTG